MRQYIKKSNSYEYFFPDLSFTTAHYYLSVIAVKTMEKQLIDLTWDAYV